MVAIKAEGNEHFKKTHYEQAISVYQNALNLCKGNDDLKEEQGTILKNKAACYLKMVRTPFHDELLKVETARNNLLPTCFVSGKLCQCIKRL